MRGIVPGSQRHVALCCLRVILIIQVVHGISAFDYNFSGSPLQLDDNSDGDRPTDDARGVIRPIAQSVDDRQGSWIAEKELSRHEYGKGDSSNRRRKMLEDRTIKIVR